VKEGARQGSALSRFIRRRRSMHSVRLCDAVVLMCTWMPCVGALRYTLGSALLLERVGRTFLQLDLHTVQGVNCVQRQSISVCEHAVECASAPQQRYARK
jgi:hypothetical protein